jgi:hypothetical protein
LISTTSTSVESNIVAGVCLLWITLFILFFRTSDS